MKNNKLCSKCDKFVSATTRVSVGLSAEEICRECNIKRKKPNWFVLTFLFGVILAFVIFVIYVSNK